MAWPFPGLNAVSIRKFCEYFSRTITEFFKQQPMKPICLCEKNSRKKDGFLILNADNTGK